MSRVVESGDEVMGTEVVGVLEGEAMGIVVSNLSGGGCGSGGCRGTVFCIEPLCWCLLCRGYRVVGCGGGGASVW